MTIQSLVNLIYKAMTVEFTVFGVTMSWWDFFVFSICFSLAVLLIRLLRG